MEYRKPIRQFENSGLVNPESAYYVPFEGVTSSDGHDIKAMVDRGRFFSIFAPRQSGKTTFFRRFCEEIEKDDTYIAIMLSFQTFRSLSIEEFYRCIQEDLYPQLMDRLNEVNCHAREQVKKFLYSHNLINHINFQNLFVNLNRLIEHKKIIIFIDEFDGIPLDELYNFLYTLRELYQKYKEVNNKALYSVGLVGIRDITKLVVGGVSPFNIAEQVNIPPFTFHNILELYKQYSEETNQSFSVEAVKKVHEETCGQPWLVNRLGSILTVNVKPKTTDSITEEDVDKAIEILINEENAHFDNLDEKVDSYSETFMNILHNLVDYNPRDKDQAWLKQYGLIKKQDNLAVVSNFVYRKRFSMETGVESPPIHLTKVRRIFISYAREDSAWVDRLIPYLESLKYMGVDYWDDRNIRTGDLWNEEIESAIKRSNTAICLISKSFLRSTYIRKHEIPGLLKQAEQGMTVIPILIEKCLWKKVPWLAKLQIYPGDGIPLSQSNEEEREDKLMDIVGEIGENVSFLRLYS